MSYATTGQPRLWISGAGAPTTSTLAAGGATYWDATNSVAYQNAGTGSAPVWVRFTGPTAEDYWKIRALSLTGASPKTFRKSFGTGDNGVWVAYHDGGSATANYSNKRQWLLESSAAASKRGALISGTVLGAYPQTLNGAATARWYAHWRVGLPTGATYDAEMTAGFIVFNTGGTIAKFGIHGAASATKFACVGWGGGTAVSSVAIDTGAFHEFEVFRNGTTTFFCVDEETPVSLGINEYPVNGAICYGFAVYNGASGGNRTLSFCHNVDMFTDDTGAP